MRFFQGQCLGKTFHRLLKWGTNIKINLRKQLTYLNKPIGINFKQFKLNKYTQIQNKNKEKVIKNYKLEAIIELNMINWLWFI